MIAAPTFSRLGHLPGRLAGRPRQVKRAALRVIASSWVRVVMGSPYTRPAKTASPAHIMTFMSRNKKGRCTMLQAFLDYITGQAAARKEAALSVERYKREVMLKYWAARRARDDAKARNDSRGFGEAVKQLRQINVERFRLNL